MKSTIVILPQPDALLSLLLCPRCSSLGPHHPGPGAGPHAARLVCGQCGASIKWLSKPRPVAQEVRP